jgi:hypothetical protein
VRAVELALAGVLALLGLRSLVHWVRRPFEGSDPVDHALFAAFVVGRVGAWWSMAGFFYLSATLKDPNGSGAFLQGRAFTDYFRDRFWWYPLVFVGFMAVQFVAGYFLGRRAPAPPAM